MAKPSALLDDASLSRVIEMAWDDDTPFEAIHTQFALTEGDVIALMRQSLKASSFRLWRRRVRARVSKHAALAARPRRPGMGSQPDPTDPLASDAPCPPTPELNSKTFR